MAAVESSDFGGLRMVAHPVVDRAALPRGTWVLAECSGAAVTVHRVGLLRWVGRLLTQGLRSPRAEVRTLPLVSGALRVADPVHLTVGELSIAVDKTSAVRLTVSDVTALGNQRITVDLVASALGADAGPDEPTRLEGRVDTPWGGALRVTLTGDTPAALGGRGGRLTVTADFVPAR